MMNGNNYKGPMVPWEVVRPGLHIGYDYEYGEPEQYDFICNITTEDIKKLNMYSRMKREEGEIKPPVDELEWTDIVKLTEVELNYRTVNDV